MITRRGLLTGTVAAGLAGPRVARAQAYPHRPIKAILPAGQPYTGVMLPVSLSKNAANPNAARLFASYMLTAEAQKILNEFTASPVNTPGTGALPKGFVVPDAKSAAANKDKIIKLTAM